MLVQGVYSMVRSRALVLRNRNSMILDSSIRVIILCLLSSSVSADSNQNTPEGRHGTYKLTDRPGYHKAIGLPLCDGKAEKVLDKWRGSIVIKYSKRAVSLNGEQWTFEGDYPLTNAGAKRPPDPAINGGLEIWFKRSHSRGLATLVFSDDGRTCQTSIAFIGKWVEP
jgi:hypothetical protein